MKPIWKGSISFGLVSIPIRLYSAVQSHSLGFKLLCADCNTPIKYLRWCPKCEHEVAWQNVVKGIEIKKGQYFVVSQETIDALRPEKSNTIDIIEFVDAQEISPLYYDAHYYCAPEKDAEKAYFLLQQALKDLSKVAIGRFVMKEKEYTVALQVHLNGILLTTLNYEYEIRPMEQIESLAKVPKVDLKELTLAKRLVQQLSVKKFSMKPFKDTFAEKLKALIKARKKGKLVEIEKPKKSRKLAKQPSLTNALKESLQHVARS